MIFHGVIFLGNVRTFRNELSFVTNPRFQLEDKRAFSAPQIAAGDVSVIAIGFLRPVFGAALKSFSKCIYRAIRIFQIEWLARSSLFVVSVVPLISFLGELRPLSFAYSRHRFV